MSYFITSIPGKNLLKQEKSCVKFNAEISSKKVCVGTIKDFSVEDAPVSDSRLTTIKLRHWWKQISIQRFKRSLSLLKCPLEVFMAMVSWRSSMFGYRTNWTEFIRRGWTSAFNSPNAKKTIRSWSVCLWATKNETSTTMWAKTVVRISEMKRQEA